MAARHTSGMTMNQMWQAVLSRDAEPAEAFVYAVRTTGIYCRPSCPSRRPKQESVAYFSSPDLAELAGYRECRRCRPRQGKQVPPGLAETRRACAYIAAHVEEPITLADLARHVGGSPFHLQRTFTRIVGLSPRAYQDALRAHRFRGELREGQPLTAAVYDAGYGSVSRVYERRPTGRGMTPAQHRRGGRGADVVYTVLDSPLGRLLIAGTVKGVCAVMLGEADRRLEEQLRREYPEARLERDDTALLDWARATLEHLEGTRPDLRLPVDVQGTAFQWKVWRYLQSIPYGQTRSYGEVAHAIGAPTSARAVARACATNKVCLVVPCHRVVGKNGTLTGYRWGLDRKRSLLQKEA